MNEYKSLLMDWFEELPEDEQESMKGMQIIALLKFTSWLDTRSPTPIGAERDTCPVCKGEDSYIVNGKKYTWCFRCKGTGQA